jgi:hypothetical protein
MRRASAESDATRGGGKIEEAYLIDLAPVAD